MAEIETDIEFETDDELPALPSGEEELDPVVLAYRVGDHRRHVRLRRSEVRADPGLVEVGKTAQSAGYDPIESLNREPEEVRPADSYVQREGRGPQEAEVFLRGLPIAAGTVVL